MRTTRHLKYFHTGEKKGVILLLVVIVLTAIFSISIGVFGVIIGQVSISETFENSNIALYAADQGIEHTLYRDRQEHDYGIGTAEETLPSALLPSGGCASIIVAKTSSPDTTQITAQGLSNACGVVTTRTVARAFLTKY